MDDAELVRQVLAGNTDAYADLALRWAARVTALCHARLARADLGFAPAVSLEEGLTAEYQWLMGILK